MGIELQTIKSTGLDRKLTESKKAFKIDDFEGF
jgi:hypothetical protein